MGCAQSKTNEQDVVDPNDPNVADFTGTEVVLPVGTADTQPQAVENHDVAKEEPAVEVKTPDFALQFVPGEVSINEYGVAFYNFDGSNPTDPSLDVHVCKRYSEFKDIHAEIAKLMASEKNVKAEDRNKFQTYPALPSMPPANAITYVLGRGNPKVVKEREAQFVKILNAIAKHPIAAHSKTFTDFMT
ncbi:hypothetical protein PHYSODRAFT_501451 [Phytophthora sojae]|uniref:PX domain-containing protein n=1 Tax=Phytophthora sojae (strain P6497) TaxID=1094619 RepID=G4ZD60_PHYSP|nr:hypothetical protein PHYSODRAFT_501451 [Phytophthora sojae]EGZ16468.1 hypothetical protein PHYSODRAFT_501451 [Phytophthora sojae]|eukprot:XP_009525526.1 hypothetical protein PHYSODRAFT_501451 [Phytophthora sojae]